MPPNECGGTLLQKITKCPVLLEQEENVDFLCSDFSRVVDKFFKTSVPTRFFFASPSQEPRRALSKVTLLIIAKAIRGVHQAGKSSTFVDLHAAVKVNGQRKVDVLQLVE